MVLNCDVQYFQMQKHKTTKNGQSAMHQLTTDV